MANARSSAVALRWGTDDDEFNFGIRAMQQLDARNKFLKVYFDWEHAMFGNPVFSNTDHFQKSNDLYWLRLQAYF
jgi:hypothetical protein